MSWFGALAAMPTSSKRRPAGIADVETSRPLQVLLDVLAARVDEVPPQLDATGWSSFVAEASRHGVSALANLRLTHCEGVPPDVVRRLEGQYLKNRLRNLRLYAHLGAVLERLSAEAIDVVVLKGAYLAQAIYPDAALRAMADADLLVRQCDLERAAQALREMGWRQEAGQRTSAHQLGTFELEGVQVELHWTIEDDGAPFAIDVAGLWSRAVPARIGRAQALARSPADLLLHLCLHTAYGHGWKQFDGGLRQLADIAAVVRHRGSALEWHDVALRAEAWGAQRCVALCLVTARDLVRAEVPQAVLDRLTQPHSRWMQLARELSLGSHYAELVRCLPVFARSWIDKRWVRLTHAAR